MPHSLAPQRDAGFSLVELAVYVLVLGIISTVVAMVAVSLFRSEQTVSRVTSASNDSQVISTLLGNDIRNARAFKVSANAVVASVASSDSTVSWQCVQWVVSTTSNSLTRQALPDTGTVPSWTAGTTLAKSVTRVSASTPYFSGGSSATEAGTAIGSVTYNFALPSAGTNTLQASGMLSNRVAQTGARCW